MKLFNRIVGIVLAVTLVVALLISSLTWLFTPMLSKKLLRDVLVEHNLALSDRSVIRLNLFTTTLTVSELSWSAKESGKFGSYFGDEEFRLEKLVLDFRVLPLLRSTVSIEELAIQGIDARVVQSEYAQFVLGFDVSSSENHPDDAMAGSVDNTSDTDNAVGVDDTKLSSDSTEQTQVAAEVKRIVLEDIKVSVLEILHASGEVDEKSEALIGGVERTRDEIKAEQVIYIQNLEISNLNKFANIVDAKFKLNAALNPDLNQVLSASTNKSIEAPQFPHVQGDLDIELSIRAELPSSDANDIVLMVENLDVGLNNIMFADSTMQALLSTLKLKSERLRVLVAEKIQAEGELDFSLDELKVLNTLGDTLADMTELSAEKMSLKFDSDKLAVDTPMISFDELVLSSKREGDAAALFAWQSLDVKELGFNYDLANANGGLAIDLIEVRDIRVNANRSTEGDILNLVDISAFTESGESVPDQVAGSENEERMNETGASGSTPFNIKVDQFRFASPAQLNVADSSITPSLNKQFVIDSLELKNVDSSQPDQALTLDLKIHDGEYFKYDITAQAKLFQEKLTMDMRSNVSEFGVHEISPYLSSSLGFGIETGQLDSVVDIAVVEDLLDGKVKIDLRGAKFSSGDDAQKNELDLVGQTAVPLNVALNMLKDGKGNIGLTIPVSGDINDPNFGMQYFLGLVVKKAVMSQAKKHLVNTFIPYGQVLSIAYSAGSYALKVRFEDLEFLPAGTEFSDGDIEFMAQFATLMKEKQDLQVRVCPIATLSELPLLDSSVSSDAIKNTEVLTKARQEQLISLAKARADHFKQKVTAQGVASSRLLICSPEIDSSESAAPRLKFST